MIKIFFILLCVLVIVLVFENGQLRILREIFKKMFLLWEEHFAEKLILSKS